MESTLQLSDMATYFLNSAGSQEYEFLIEVLTQGLGYTRAAFINRIRDMVITEESTNMKPQTIFNRVVRHLAKQKANCVNEEGSCLYRGEGGTMCAVGALMPNDMYEESMEDKSAESLFKFYPKIGKYFGIKNKDLLQSLQRVHDECTTDGWGRGLRYVAEDFKLNTNAMKGLTFTQE